MTDISVWIYADEEKKDDREETKLEEACSFRSMANTWHEGRAQCIRYQVGKAQPRTGILKVLLTTLPWIP